MPLSPPLSPEYRGEGVEAAARPRAFTLAELIVGLLLLAIIGGATAAVASAVSRGWQMGETARSSTMTITRTMLRIQDKVQRAKVIGQFRAGSVESPQSVPGAAVLFWREDANGDRKMQMEETQLLEYDPAGQTLLVHEIVFPDAASRFSGDGPFDPAILSDANAIDQYKGMKYHTSHVITKKVTGAAFNVVTPASPSQRPQMEYRLRFDGSNGQTVEYGTASPRSPIRE